MENKHLPETGVSESARENVENQRENKLINMLESYNESQGYSFQQSGGVFDQIYQYVPTKVRAGST